MENLKPKTTKQIDLQRKRGLILYLLYTNRPKWTDLAAILFLLDSLNVPLTSAQLSNKIDFLRSVGLVKVQQNGGKTDISEAEQERLIQRCFDADGDLDDEVSVRLSPKGINFQEGSFEVDGITRRN